jgi:peptidase M23-like protein
MTLTEHSTPTDTGRRRRAAAWLLIAGVVAVSAAALIGLLSNLYALGLMTVLLAAMPAAGRPIRWSGRTAIVTAGIVLCFGWLVGVEQAARYVTIPAGAIQPILISLQVVSTLAIVLPLAMPASAGTSRFEVLRRDLVLAVGAILVLTLTYLAGNTFLVLLFAALVLPAVFIVVRIRQARRRETELRWWRRPALVVQVLLALVFCALLAATTQPGTYDVLGSPAWPVAVVAGAILLGLLALLPRRRISVALTALLALTTAFLGFNLAMVYRSPGGAVTLSAPFAGDWFVVQGGHSELVNYHHSSPSQSEAYDILRVRDHSTHRAGDARVTAYYAFDQPLLAPADGTVVHVRNDLPDRPVASPDPQPENATGNVVVLDIGNGRYVLMAHLKRGSVLVAVGDRVRDGQPIARVGNSGNTDEPHLHIQAQDSARADVQRGGVTSLPILFRDVVATRDGNALTSAAADLRRGDYLRSTTR